MFDDIKAYFIENVLVLYKDYLKTRKTLKLASSNDLRTAINLSTALYHFREHIPTKIKKSRNEYVKICPDYNLLGDVVNASKHKTLDRHNPQISDASNIYEQVVSTEYKDKEGVYNYIEKTVIAELNNGEQRDLHEIIINVMNLWIQELNSTNILENYPIQKLKSNRTPRRNKNSGMLNLQMMQNLRFATRFKVQRFNYKTNKIEPIDLTKENIKMNFYKQVHTVTLTFTKTDQSEINLDLDMNEAEFKQYSKYKTEKEKIEFLVEIAKERGFVK